MSPWLHARLTAHAACGVRGREEIKHVRLATSRSRQGCEAESALEGMCAISSMRGLGSLGIRTPASLAQCAEICYHMHCRALTGRGGVRTALRGYEYASPRCARVMHDSVSHQSVLHIALHDLGFLSEVPEVVDD